MGRRRAGASLTRWRGSRAGCHRCAMQPNGSAAHDAETAPIRDAESEAESLRLAGLPDLAYGRKRKPAGEKLGLSLAWLEHFCVRWDRIRHWRDNSGTRWAEPGRGAGRRFAIEPLWCARPPCAVAL